MHDHPSPAIDELDRWLPEHNSTEIEIIPEIIPVNCTLVHPVDYLRTCVNGGDELLGIALGFTTVITWLTAHVTLLLLRQRELTRLRRSSVFPLLHDFVADACDCTASILTKQSNFQIFFSLYQLGADVLAAFQYIVVVLAKRCESVGDDEVFEAYQKSKKKQRRGKRTRLRSVVFPGVVTWFLLLAFHYIYADSRLQSRKDLPVQKHHSRVLLSTEDTTTHQDVIQILGFTIAGISVFLYWLRRAPVLYAVFQERYIGRLRYAYHWQCLLGNALYASTVLHQCHTMDDLLHSLPWSISRVGLVGMDLGLLIQMHINERMRNRGKELKEDIVSVLRNKYHRHSSSRSSVIEESTNWVPMKPMKNRYLQKMTRIAKHLDNQLSDSSEHSDSPDETGLLMTQSNGAPAVFPPRQVTQADDTTESSSSAPPTDSESEVVRRIWQRYRSNPNRIRNKDITWILAAEDRAVERSKTSEALVPSLCWSGTEDFFELNEDEITSILEAEDQYREGIPKVNRRVSCPAVTPTNGLRPHEAPQVNIRSFSEGQD